MTRLSMKNRQSPGHSSIRSFWKELRFGSPNLFSFALSSTKIDGQKFVSELVGKVHLVYDGVSSNDDTKGDSNEVHSQRVLENHSYHMLMVSGFSSIIECFEEL